MGFYDQYFAIDAMPQPAIVVNRSEPQFSPQIYDLLA